MPEFLSQLRSLATEGVSESVIRRAVALLCFTLPATLLNLGLSYSASRILDPSSFGIFYAAITGINVLFAPAVIANLYFSRYVATLTAHQGVGHADDSLRFVFNTLAKWIGVLLLAALTLVVLLSLSGRHFALPLAILVLLIVYTSYLAEAGRIVLQGVHRFMRLGAYTLSWMVARFVLGLAGLYIFGTVWGGLTGVLLSAPIVFAMFFGLPAVGLGREVASDPKTARLGEIMPLAIGYTIFAATAHADIAVAYLRLPPIELGVYSASSVLPKGLLMATLPILQLAFPMMVGRQVASLPGRIVITKGLVLTLLLSSVGAAMIMVLSGPVCTGNLGFKACDATTMAFGLIAIIAFSVIRFLVSVDFSAKRDWIPSTMIVPLCLYGLAAMGTSVTPEEVAKAFCLFSLATLLFYPLLRFSWLFVDGRARSETR